MRIRKLCIAVGSVMTFLIGVSIPMTATYADESTGTIMMIEEGRVLNPEVLNRASPSNNGGSSTRTNSVDEGVTSEPLQLEPTWKNPNYMGSRMRSVKNSVCTSTNYKVITKVGSNGGYVYTCWTGSGFYYSKTAFDTWGGGVYAVCPGKNRGAIYIMEAWRNNGNWRWSKILDPKPNNGGNYCSYFSELMKYRAVMLN